MGEVAKGFKVMTKTFDKITSKEVLREEKSHGGTWNTMHGGYFSSAEIAVSLIAKIADKLKETEADTIVDLGGGTGFVLEQVSKKAGNSNLKMVNLDLSSEQLNGLLNDKIIPKNGSIATFKRADIADSDANNILFTSRSTLHYAGEEGLLPLLQHIRSEMKKGEFFIHQTACFANQEDADTLNMIYKMIGTDKWYPTHNNILDILQICNFVTLEKVKAPILNLTSSALAERYNVSQANILSVIEKMTSQHKTEVNPVFRTTSDGFNAELHYMIFVCQAV